MGAEVWKPIPMWPGYEASSEGRIRNAKTGHTLSQNMRKGYLRVTLGPTGRRTRLYVHQIVLSAFKGPRPDGLVSRHLDGDATNNKASNLCYGTQAQNMQDSREHGTAFSIAPTRHDAQAICRRYANGEQLEDIAASLSCTAMAVRSIVSPERRAEYFPAKELQEIEQQIDRLSAQRDEQRQRAELEQLAQSERKAALRIEQEQEIAERDAEVYRMRASGMSLRAIARAVGYASGCHSVLKALDRHRNRTGAPALSFRAVLPQTTAAEQRARRCHALHSQGLGVVAIAKQLGVSRETVRTALKRAQTIGV